MISCLNWVADIHIPTFGGHTTHAVNRDYSFQKKWHKICKNGFEKKNPKS